MPEISRFYGIVIRMFFDDHPPPHFHAVYGSTEAVFEIATLSMIQGRLPPRARGLVVEWSAQHQEELMELWEQAEGMVPLHKIEPLS